MFRTIIEISLIVFFAQGALLLPLIAWAGFSWFRQMTRLTALEKELGEDRKQSERTLGSLLKRLPHLQPLNCANCGGALALDPAATVCTRCRATAPVPADYAATIKLRGGLERLTRAALRQWLLARILVSFPARAFFFIMIFVEPLLLVFVLIGGVEYQDTVMESVLQAIGETWSLVLGFLSFGAFILWMIVFIFLANLAKDLRRSLGAFPRFRRAADETLLFANCQSCGGGVHFGSRAFAALCNYCGVENFRADHTARARAEGEDRQLTARSTLFGAMEVIEGFTGTFFVVMTILTVGFGLLVLFSALGAD
jgi:hypothetical protein